MKEIDDYELYDLDFEEWLRRGRAAFGMEEDNGLFELENKRGTAADHQLRLHGLSIPG